MQKNRVFLKMVGWGPLMTDLGFKHVCGIVPVRVRVRVLVGLEPTARRRRIGVEDPSNKALY